MKDSPASHAGIPQLEGGYTRIANELIDALLDAGLTSRQWAVVMAVIRKTYGFHKTRENLSLSQLSDMTGMSRANASRTVAELVERGILSRTDERASMVLGLIKRYKNWGLPKQQQGLPKQQHLEGCQIGNGGCQNSNSTGVANSATEVLPIRQQQVLPIQQPHIKEKKKERKERAQAPVSEPLAEVVLPEWVDIEAWEGWLEVRRKKRVPNTARAIRQNLAVLEAEHRAKGDPIAILNRSIASGWTGLFRRETPKQQAASNAREQALLTGMWNGRPLTPTERYMLENNPSYLPMAAGGG